MSVEVKIFDMAHYIGGEQPIRGREVANFVADAITPFPSADFKTPFLGVFKVDVSHGITQFLYLKPGWAVQIQVMP